MKIAVGFAAAALSICALGTVEAASSNDTVTGSYMNRGLSPNYSEPVADVAPPVMSVLGIDVFTTQAAFDAVCAPGPLTKEDFECGNVGPGTAIGCPGAPFNNNTNNGCFPLNCIAPGLTIDALNNHQIYLGGANFFGSTSKYVGADFFVDSYENRYSPAVQGTSMQLHCVFGNDTVTIQVFNAANLLIGTTTRPCGPNPGTFVGIKGNAGDTIGRVNIFSPGGQAEGVDDVHFGSCGPQIVCGNGILEAGEQCDDGNTNSGDGCSNTCQTEIAPCDLAPIEAKLDAAEVKLDTINATTTTINTNVNDIETNTNEIEAAIAVLEGKLDAGTGCDACEIVRLLTSPQLPGAPAMPSTHPCFVPPPFAPVAPATTTGSLRGR